MMGNIIKDRKVTNTKEDIFDTYVNVLMFMIENKGKSFMNSDIKHSIFGETTDTATKNMVKKVVDFYIESGIFVKVTEINDVNGKTVELKPNQNRVRLYDKDIDSVDENGEYYEDDYIVNLHIPKSRDGIERLCQTVASMVTQIPYADIYTPTIKTVLESQLFGFQTSLVAETIGKSLLKKHNLENDSTNYPLDVITSIIKSNINVDVKFENFGNTIELKNTKIKRITIKENGFDVHFDNFISQNQSDLNQILSIENSSESGLREDIETVKGLIENLPSEEKEKISDILESVSVIMELFVF